MKKDYGNRQIGDNVPTQFIFNQSYEGGLHANR
jgi:hypothetical protein